VGETHSRGIQSRRQWWSPEIQQTVNAIGVRELEEHTRDVLRRVRETGEILDIAAEGKVTARLIPVPPPVDAATR
jgi:hypothetical protein